MGFDSDLIIHRRPDPLLATQVSFRRLHGNMPQKELDLFELPSRSVAEAGASAAQIVRCQVLHADLFCRILHDVPDGFLGHAFSQDPPIFVTRRKILPRSIPEAFNQTRNSSVTQPGDRNGANVPSLTLQIDNSPAFLPLFEMFNFEANAFVATQTAGKQQKGF